MTNYASKKPLTFTLVGIPGGRARPRPIKIEGLAFLAVASGGVVLALAPELSVLAHAALGRVSVALAPASDGEVGYRVVVSQTDAAARWTGGRGHRHEAHLLELHAVVALQLLGRENLVNARETGSHGVAEQAAALLALELGLLALALRDLFQSQDLLTGRRVVLAGGRHVEPVEDYSDVGGGHPVLENGRVVEIGGRWSALEGAEGDSTDRSEAVAPGVAMAVRAPGLLLVGLGYGSPVGPSVDLLAHGRVELEGLPGLAVVHGLVNCDGVWFGGLGAELKTYVSQFVLLAQGECQGDVVRRSGETLGRHQGLASPAGDVVRVVEIGQVGGGESSPGHAVVAHVTLTSWTIAREAVAVARGSADSARGRRHDRALESGVHEVRDAATRTILVVAWIRGASPVREHPREHLVVEYHLVRPDAGHQERQAQQQQQKFKHLRNFGGKILWEKWKGLFTNQTKRVGVYDDAPAPNRNI